MKHTIQPNTPKSVLLDLVAKNMLRASHVQFKRPGMSKLTTLALNLVPDELAGQAGAVEIEIGKAQPGLPFEPLDLQPAPIAGVKGPAPAAPAPKVPAPALAPAPKATVATKKDAPKPKPTPAVDSIESLRALRLKSGTYIGYIDSLILDLAEQQDSKDEYPRSRHNIFDAVALVSKKFPDKDVASVKRICKVRPRHLERMKTLGVFDEDAGKRAPRWARVGPGVKAPAVEKKVSPKIAKAQARKRASVKANKGLAKIIKKSSASEARKKAWATRRANAAKKGGASK